MAMRMSRRPWKWTVSMIILVHFIFAQVVVSAAAANNNHGQYHENGVAASILLATSSSSSFGVSTEERNSSVATEDTSMTIPNCRNATPCVPMNSSESRVMCWGQQAEEEEEREKNATDFPDVQYISSTVRLMIDDTKISPRRRKIIDPAPRTSSTVYGLKNKGVQRRQLISSSSTKRGKFLPSLATNQTMGDSDDVSTRRLSTAGSYGGSEQEAMMTMNTDSPQQRPASTFTVLDDYASSLKTALESSIRKSQRIGGSASSRQRNAALESSRRRASSPGRHQTGTNVPVQSRKKGTRKGILCSSSGGEEG